MPNARAPKRCIKTAEVILARLYDMENQHPDSRCGVANEHKEAFRIYLQSWIIPNAEALVDDLNGGEPVPYWMTNR
jgi:hypothetical protein